MIAVRDAIADGLLKWTDEVNDSMFSIYLNFFDDHVQQNSLLIQETR